MLSPLLPNLSIEHRISPQGLCQLLEPALLIRCRQADHALVEQVICLVCFFLRQDLSTWGEISPKHFSYQVIPGALAEYKATVGKDCQVQKDLPLD